MKKLLLPLLAASALLLAGCSQFEETKGRDFGWKTLKPNEYIEVHYSTNTDRFSANRENEIKYRFISYESVAELFVEQTQNGYHQNSYYIGTDLTVLHYEI